MDQNIELRERMIYVFKALGLNEVHSEFELCIDNNIFAHILKLCVHVIDTFRRAVESVKGQIFFNL